MNWQVQEAKQRFSEVLRAVERTGPQIITRLGEEIAVLIDMAEYRKRHPASRMCSPRSRPKRKKDLPRHIDFGNDE
ncbi:MAG: type II toxin-antitoxin system Phd/YefM family antitoxin [Pseudonocardiaceae bacterium]